MHFFVDESGDYGFPVDKFDCYTLVAFICPDRVLDALDERVHAMQQRLGVTELHAADMPPSALAEMCDFIASRPLRAAVNVMDTQFYDEDEIQRWRQTQLTQLAVAHAAGRRRGRDSAELTRRVQEYIKRAGHRSRLSNGDFIQASQTPGLLFNAFTRAAEAFESYEWADEFADFHFVLDAKEVGKLAPGEKYLRDICPAVWASQPPGSMNLPESWERNPELPFRRKYEQGEGICISRIFEHGLEFAPSHSHAGLQIADIIAFTVRKAIMRPIDPVIRAAYDRLRPVIAGPAGRCFLILGRLSPRLRIRLMLGERSPEQRYGPLYLAPGAVTQSIPGVQQVRGMYHGLAASGPTVR